MKKYRTLIFSLFFIAFTPGIRAQTSAPVSITGSLVDSVSGAPLMHAAVILRRQSDSTMIRSLLSDSDGRFQFRDIDEGFYLLQCSYLGYRPLKKELEISGAEGSLTLGRLSMIPRNYLLEQVTVREDRIPIMVKGDTLEYDAGAFKVADGAVVEELLKKLPGVEVERDGSIRAMGQQVEEVTVDGNPFFGNDPKIAAKNLPANIVDKVQVVDKKSEQAQFSQIDDGQNKKSINLKLKEDKKQGLFGNAALGGGAQERFAGKVNINRFDRGDQLSLIGSGNNLNQQGFSLSDALIMRGGGFAVKGNAVTIRMGGPGGSGAPDLNGRGITTAWSGGLNFREQLGSRLTSSGSYFFNRTNTANEQLRQRENLLANGRATNYEETGATQNDADNHRLRLDLEYEIDSMSSLQFKPTFTFTDSEVDYFNDYRTKSPDDFLLNDGQSRYATRQRSPNLGAELLYRRRFDREGRTFSAAFQGGWQQPEAEQTNESLNTFYKSGSSLTDTIRQRQIREEHSLRGKMRFNYTEPISHNKRLGIFYEWDRSRQESDQQGFDFNPESELYDRPNNLFTNQFKNDFLIHEAGLQLQFHKLRYKLTLGAGAQRSSIESLSLGEENGFEKSFFNIFPLAIFNYSFSTTRNLEVTYRTNTRQPSINELQPVPDNRNPQFIQLGNPELQPEFIHQFRINYRNFNMQSLQNIFAVLNFSATANRIVQSSFIDDSGRQVSRPVNADGAISGNGFFVFGLPLRGNQFRMHLSTQLNYQQYDNFINDAENRTQTFLAGQRLRLSYDLEDKLYAGLSANLRYNRADYSLQPFRNAEFMSYGATFDLIWELPLGFRLESEVDYQVNSGGTEVYNNQAVLLNAAIAKDLFDGQRGSIELRAFDLLNQNVSISRNTGDNYVEDIRNSALGQYFILRFRYRFGQFGGEGIQFKKLGR